MITGCAYWIIFNLNHICTKYIFLHLRGKVTGEIRRVRRTGVFSLPPVSFAPTPREGATRVHRVPRDLLLEALSKHASRCNVTQLCHLEFQALDMNFITKPLYEHAKLFMLLSFALAIILTGVFLRLNNNTVEEDETRDVEYDSMINATGTEPRKTRRKEYLYRLLTNTTRSLIQMEIKARRLEENMRRIKEKTADLLWKNKDKALWHILFKNISRHISIRHEFHQHSSLKRIMQDSHGHVHNRRRKVFLSS